MPAVEGHKVPEGHVEGSAPPSSPTPHGTVFGLNDGGEMVGPSRAEAVSGGVVRLCRALRGDEEDLAQWVARDADR